MTHDDCRALLGRHFTEGDLSGLQQQAMRSHLRGCVDCRKAFDAHALAEAALGPNAAGERMAREHEHWRPAPAPASGRSWTRVLAFGGAGLLAAGLAFTLGRTAGAPALEDEVQARGGASGPVATAWIALHRQRGDDTEPLGRTMSSSDALLVAYTNGGGSAATYLAVAARDATGHVHWLYPAWENAQTAPVSVPIAQGVADEELPDAVVPNPPVGPLEICALFTRTPLNVPEVDAALEKGGEWPAAEAIDCHMVRVEP
jgi:hypothetical protein